MTVFDNLFFNSEKEANDWIGKRAGGCCCYTKQKKKNKTSKWIKPMCNNVNFKMKFVFVDSWPLRVQTWLSDVALLRYQYHYCLQFDEKGIGFESSPGQSIPLLNWSLICLFQHTQVINMVFLTYFRILKQARYSRLLSSVLEGLSKWVQFWKKFFVWTSWQIRVSCHSWTLCTNPDNFNPTGLSANGMISFKQVKGNVPQVVKDVERFIRAGAENTMAELNPDQACWLVEACQLLRTLIEWFPWSKQF